MPTLVGVSRVSWYKSKQCIASANARQCTLPRKRGRVEWTRRFICVDRLRAEEGTTRAEDAQGTLTQSHISPRLLVYEENSDARDVFSRGVTLEHVKRGCVERSGGVDSLWVGNSVGNSDVW